MNEDLLVWRLNAATIEFSRKTFISIKLSWPSRFVSA